MSKYNPSAKLKARHLWRTYIKDGKEVNVEMDFTHEAWKHLGAVRHDGKMVPKQGFVLISDVPEPPEVKKPAGEKSGAASQSTGKPKTPPAINVDEIQTLINSDEKEKLPMSVLVAFVAAKSLDIPNADKMPQHELFDMIKSMTVTA